MTEVLRAAAALQAVCEQYQWRNCFIGGLGVLRWGEPRETVDVDAPDSSTGWSGAARNSKADNK